MSRVSFDSPSHSRFLVVGSGIAGLQYALLVARYGTVQIVTKKESKESATNYAQGGIAAVLDPDDSFEEHVRDTLVAGDGLCDEDVVRCMVKAGPHLVQRLFDFGVAFSRSGTDLGSPYALGREGGHSKRRIVHAQDLTGRELESRLLAACQEHPNIQVAENHLGMELIKGEDLGCRDGNAGRVVGCWVFEREARIRRPYLADTVILATGGCGKVYAYTSNPDIATGDGLAMSWRAGATLANLEFVQFHPTCLYHPDAKSFLISEAVRGEGAVLINRQGEAFMSRYHSQADLAPRDIVARSIDQEMKNSGDTCVYLDLGQLERSHIEERFPNLVKICRGFGIDMAGEAVPVVPAAHYMCGGVLVDGDGRTDLPGLFAIGETACTGVHGANRLASNSLLEAVYFAERAALASVADEPWYTAELKNSTPRDEAPSTQSRGPTPMILEHDWDSVRRVMWDYVGIVRSGQRLKIAGERLEQIRRTVGDLFAGSPVSADLIELRNISLMGELIVRCAVQRKESRGLHYNLDFPTRLPSSGNTLIRRDPRDFGAGD